MSDAKTQPQPAPAGPAGDRVRSILDRWDAKADRYELDVKTNRLHALSVKEYVEDFQYLLDRAFERRQHLSDRDREHLLNMDRDFREFEQNHRKQVDENRRAPMGLGYVVRNVRFLARVAAAR